MSGIRPFALLSARWAAPAFALLVLVASAILFSSGAGDRLAELARRDERQPGRAEVKPSGHQQLVIVEGTDGDGRNQAIGQPRSPGGTRAASGSEVQEISDEGEDYIVIDAGTPVQAASDEDLIVSGDPLEP